MLKQVGTVRQRMLNKYQQKSVRGVAAGRSPRDSGLPFDRGCPDSVYVASGFGSACPTLADRIAIALMIKRGWRVVGLGAPRSGEVDGLRLLNARAPYQPLS